MAVRAVVGGSSGEERLIIVIQNIRQARMQKEEIRFTKRSAVRSNRRLSTYIGKLARLGGYLARRGDPPPGSTVMWKGLSRLVDIELGFSLASELVGN